MRLVFGRPAENVSEKERIDFATGDARIVESGKRCIGEQFGETPKFVIPAPTTLALAM
ncbi:MAG: hypothetical protein V5A36_03950 [Natronomonas sp.]